MTDAAHHARPTRTLVGVVLAAVVALVVPAVAVAAPPEGKGPSAPSSGGNATSIVFAQIMDVGTTLPDTPGASKLAYVVAGEPFTVDLTFVDKQGRPTPLSSNDPVDVVLSYSGQGVTPVTETVDAGESTAVVNVTIPDAARNVRLSAVAETSPKQISGSSELFDVLLESVVVDGTTSVGDRSDAGCDPNPGTPVCGDLVPPSNGFDGTGYLSLADCVTERNGVPDCKQSYVQALSKFKSSTGSLPPPATLFMKCDKTLCGGGAINKKGLTVALSSDPNSEFFGEFDAPACQAKGMVSYDPDGPYGRNNLPFCIDYVQSTRDIAGDTILALLFVVDAKVRFL